MARLSRNFLSGTLTDNPLLIGGTTANSANFANLPVVAGADYMWLVLDPTSVAGAPEIVKVTAHSSSATSVTITRAQQSTTARQHLSATIWRAVYTQSDAEGSLLAQASVATGDLLYASSATAVSRLAIGAATTVLHGGTTPSYSAIATADITDDAVTIAKIGGSAAKGDLLTNTGAAAAAWLTAGADYKVLQALAAQSTGLRYVDVALGVINYAEATSNQGSITGAVDLTSLTITFTAISGRRYKITGSVNYFSSVANDIARMHILAGATTIEEANVCCVSTTIGMTLQRSAVVNNLSGSTTVKLVGSRPGGSGNVSMAGSATVPAYILVEDIGV